MPVAATEVPDKYDVVIDGEGYVFAESIESTPFGSQRATYGFSPTFVPRTNVQGDYGDNQQDFWLTFTQRDWSLGEEQRYFRSRDEESVRRYWKSHAVMVNEPGEVTLRKTVDTITAAAAVKAVCDANAGVFYCTTTNLYEVSSTGTVTDRGAHGVGAAPGTFAMVADETGDVYISASGQQTRKWNGATFASFGSAGEGVSVLAYLNNALYGYDLGSLYRWTTTGTRSVLHTFQGVDGAANSTVGRLSPFGGDLLVLIQIGGRSRAELHIYDGVGVSRVQDFPVNLEVWDLEVLYGIAFISGRLIRRGPEYRPTIYYWAAGQMGILWEAEAWTSSNYTVACNSFESNLVFNDDGDSHLMAYNLETGAATSLGDFTVAGDTPLLACSRYHVLHTRNQTAAYLYPGSSVISTGTLFSSLFDGDVSLLKQFHAVVIDYDEGSDGDGGSVDVAYVLENLDGTYTNIQTGVVSGTEYVVGQSGHSIGLRITLNKGTSTRGPRLKRLAMRGAPKQASYRRVEYALNLSGRRGEGMVRLRDGRSIHAKDGLIQAAALQAVATAGATVTVTDYFGTFSGVIENEGFRIIAVRPEVFLAIVPVRQI